MFGSHHRAAAAHERIEHEVVSIGEQTDQLLGQLHRKRRRMVHAPGALGRDVPQIKSEFHELVCGQIVLPWQALSSTHLGTTRPIETTLAGHDDPFGDITEHRIRRATK